MGNISNEQTLPSSPQKGDQRKEEPIEKEKSLYKTELCVRYSETGSCRYGEKCQFAHGVQELKQAQRHPKYKTIKCKSFWGPTGRCPYGARCKFIHEEIGGMKNNTSCINTQLLQGQLQNPTGLIVPTSSPNAVPYGAENSLFSIWNSRQSEYPLESEDYAAPLSMRECKHIVQKQASSANIIAPENSTANCYRQGYNTWRAQQMFSQQQQQQQQQQQGIPSLKNGRQSDLQAPYESYQPYGNIAAAIKEDMCEQQQSSAPLYRRECRHLDSQYLLNNREQNQLVDEEFCKDFSGILGLSSEHPFESRRDENSYSDSYSYGVPEWTSEQELDASFERSSNASTASTGSPTSNQPSLPPLDYSDLDNQGYRLQYHSWRKQNVM